MNGCPEWVSGRVGERVFCDCNVQKNETDLCLYLQP